MPEPLLRVRDLTVTFESRARTVHAVRGVDYEVHPGEFLAIVGESGSGKSVSSMAVMGLLPNTANVSGSITYEGRQLLGATDRQMSALRGSDIAMVFQDPLSALTPVYTIGQQIIEGLVLHQPSLTRQELEDRAIELLDIVGIPEPRRRVKSFPHEFSGGMRQRAMIAIAIANDPKLIIADEPTTALDVTIQAQILDVLQTAKDITGAAVILITHDLGVVAGNADRVAVMYAGRIVETAPVDDLFARPSMPYTIGLLRSTPNLAGARSARLVPLEGRPPQLTEIPTGCPFADRCPVVISACRELEPELAPIAPLQSSACLRSAEIVSDALPRDRVFSPPEPPAAEVTRADETPRTVLSVDALKRHFPLTKGTVFRRRVGTVRAVDGVSFELSSGQTLGLVGESGCGKSTTVMEVMELARPQSGSIAVNDKDTATLSASDRRALRTDIQIVFQDPAASLDPRMTVGELIGEPLTVHHVPAEEISRRVRRMLGLVGLEPSHAQRYAHEFSGGQRQRIGIARALVVEPKILVLDEPVSALDVSVQAGVINLLEDLKQQLGLSYLFVAHDLAVVRHIADDVAVMYLGRIIEYGGADVVFDDPRHPYTRALLSAVPIPDPQIERSRERLLLSGDLPSPTESITGCPFRKRCPLYAILPPDQQAACESRLPESRAVAGRDVACHWAEQEITRPA